MCGEGLTEAVVGSGVRKVADVEAVSHGSLEQSGLCTQASLLPPASATPHQQGVDCGMRSTWSHPAEVPGVQGRVMRRS
jgi:hypothetical protein